MPPICGEVCISCGAGSFYQNCSFYLHLKLASAAVLFLPQNSALDGFVHDKLLKATTATSVRVCIKLCWIPCLWYLFFPTCRRIYQAGASVCRLFFAAWFGVAKLVCQLVYQCQSQVDTPLPGTFITPLFAACYNGHPEVVSLLLDNGASVDAANAS